jgi:hypothetical protein
MIRAIIRAPEGLRYYYLSANLADLPAKPIPTGFNVLFRQYAGLSLLRYPIAVYTSTGILTSYPSDIALRLILRPRLTLIRLALIRKP